MPFEADQQSFADRPTRLFWIRATMMGVPVDGLHRLADGHATMRIKPLGAFAVVDAAGPEMDQGETVTLFNDMCLLAPGTLVDPAIQWESVDARTAKARFTHAAHTISATLLFDDEGLLKDFVSDDRLASGDGKIQALALVDSDREYRAYGPYRLAARGEARWHPPEGEYVYAAIDILEIVQPPSRKNPVTAGPCSVPGVPPVKPLRERLTYVDGGADEERALRPGCEHRGHALWLALGATAASAASAAD